MARDSMDDGPQDEPQHASATRNDALLAVVVIAQGATPDTQAELRGHARSYAEREGYDLRSIMVTTRVNATPSTTDRREMAGESLPESALPSSTPSPIRNPGDDRSPHAPEAPEITLAAVAEQIAEHSIATVLVIGPSRELLVELPRLCPVQVVTLGQERRPAAPLDLRHLNREDGPGFARRWRRRR